MKQHRKQYASLWTSNDPPGPLLSGLVHAVLALGCQFSPAACSTLADTYFRRAKTLIPSYAESLGDAPSLDHLQALALLAMYPQGPEAEEEIWNVVGTMLRLLRRSRMPDDDPTTSDDRTSEEMRIRMWWTCFVLDTVYSTYFNRQPRFPPAAKQIRLPLPLDDEDRAQEDDLSLGSLRPPPRIFFFEETIRLCRLMRDITTSDGEYLNTAQTLDIDQRILDWYSSVQLVGSATYGHSIRARLWRQCEVLTSRFLHLRVMLLTRHLQLNCSPAAVCSVTAFSSVRTIADIAVKPVLEEACMQAATALIIHLAKPYGTEDGPHSAWWYDLKKVKSSLRAMLLYLQRRLDDFAPTVQKFEIEEDTLRIAKRLLQKIRKSGDLQADKIEELENEVNIVLEQLHKVKNAHRVAEGQQLSTAAHQMLSDPRLGLSYNTVEVHYGQRWNRWPTSHEDNTSLRLESTDGLDSIDWTELDVLI